MTVTRGTTNRNARGGSDDRRRRREWLVETYRANVDVLPDVIVVQICGQPEPPRRLRLEGNLAQVAVGDGEASCRCYRCGDLLTVDTVTVDRIIPGCKGGTYRRNNIRPACGPCNTETGAALRSVS